MLKERGKRKMKWVFLHKGCPHGCRNWEWLCPKHQKDHAKISGNPAGQPEDCQHDICHCCFMEKKSKENY